MYSGKPKLNFSASGLDGKDKESIDDINKQINKELTNIEKYLKIFPIISLGIRYSF